MHAAVIAGFAHPTQGELLIEYRDRYFADVAGVWERRTSELAQAVAVGLFPTWTSTIAAETVAAADAFLAGQPGRPRYRPACGASSSRGAPTWSGRCRRRAVDAAAG